jgi:hypothetical protein
MIGAVLRDEEVICTRRLWYTVQKYLLQLQEKSQNSAFQGLS